jgi:hypothetical protein
MKCPTCGAAKPEWAIVNGKCDFCRKNEVRQTAIDEAEANGGFQRNVEIESVRAFRKALLDDTQWVLGSDSPVPEEFHEEWRNWRQRARDITDIYPTPAGMMQELKRMGVNRPPTKGL